MRSSVRGILLCVKFVSNCFVVLFYCIFLLFDTSFGSYSVRFCSVYILFCAIWSQCVSVHNAIVCVLLLFYFRFSLFITLLNAEDLCLVQQYYVFKLRVFYFKKPIRFPYRMSWMSIIQSLFLFVSLNLFSPWIFSRCTAHIKLSRSLSAIIK